MKKLDFKYIVFIICVLFYLYLLKVLSTFIIMENKELYNHLKEDDILYRSIIGRISDQNHDLNFSDETAFFAEILSLFSDDDNLPIEQLTSFKAFTSIILFSEVNWRLKRANIWRNKVLLKSKRLF